MTTLIACVLRLSFSYACGNVTNALVPCITATSHSSSSSNCCQVKLASLPKLSSCAAPALVEAMLRVGADRRQAKDQLVEAGHPDRFDRLLPVAVDRDRFGPDPFAGMQEQPCGAIERLVPRHLAHLAVMAAHHRSADPVVGDAAPRQARFTPFAVAAGQQRGLALDAEPERASG